MASFITGSYTLLAILGSVLSGGGGHYGRPNWNGGGGRGGGGGHQNPLALHHGQTNNWNNPGLGFVHDRVRVEEGGCSRPGFSDAATFEIEGCRTNLRQDRTHYCRNDNLPVPCGTSGVMSCVRGRRLLRLTSRCEDDGTWKPPLVGNCNQLFELLAEYKGTAAPPPDEEYQKPSPRHCPQVKVNRTPNFIITCHLPLQAESDPNGENCMDQFRNGVPSGTKISVKCRPPSISLQTEPNELLCQDGNWEGTVKKLICSVPTNTFVEQKPKPSPTQKPQTPLPTIPITPPSRTPKPTNPPETTTAPQQPSSPHSISCPPLAARSGVVLSCVWSATEVGTNNCRTRLPVGTEARYSCSDYYEAKGQLPNLYRKCKEDGRWSGSSEFSCSVECGRENVVKIAFITHSLPTLKGQWPWHAGIFRRSSKDKESWEYICGGTLISKTAMVTAGHCVTLLQTRQVVDKDDLQVHLGKYRREVNDEHVQIKSIQEIILNPNYNPYNYDSDLAIVIFKTEVAIGHFVRPICFLSTSDSALEDLQLSENSIGTVVGWGYDETNKAADDLRMAKLRVVGSRECSQSMIGSSITQLNARSTTFCAGYANGTNVCNGDSGSGMYFPTTRDTDTKWYIQGLVSVGIAHSNGRCNPEAYSVFTRLGRYADFITRSLSERDAL